MKTIKDPVLDFTNDEYLVIENASSKMKYCYSDPSILVTVPDGFKPPLIDITVMMSEGSFTNLRKISKKNDLPDVIVHTDGTNCYMTASERRNATSNEFTVNVTPKSEETIDCLADQQVVNDLRWKVDNLKFLPDDYEIAISL